MEVARSRLQLSLPNFALLLDPSPWHEGFIFQNDKTEGSPPSVAYNTFVFDLQVGKPDRGKNWHNLCRNEIWELWRGDSGQFIFTNPMQPLLRQVIVDPEFKRGQILGEFSGPDPQYALPQDLEIVFFANWMGKFGDLLLHASGIAVDGQGYAFAGFSGVGKSTLARQLSREESVTILGEDQLVLRYLDGRFWIFGTPWHEDRSLCAPLGVPLTKIFFLEKNPEPRYRTVSPLEGIARLLQTAFIPYYRTELLECFLERLELLARVTPMRQLSYMLGESMLNTILE